MGRPPTALIRADASAEIGTGHMVRCMALARELELRGWRTTFATRSVPAVLRREIVAAGHSVVLIPEDIPMAAEPTHLREIGVVGNSVLITDHYGVDAQWQRAARILSPVVAAIDDLAVATQAVGLLVNQNLGISVSEYDALVPTDCRLLIGPTYAILRPEFAEARAAGLRVRDHVRRILVFAGGGDHHDVTSQIVAALASSDVAIDVVIGSAYPHARSLRIRASKHTNIAVHRNTPHMSDLMLRADLAVGAPSSASWERCCLGLPSVTITLAENQTRVAAALSSVGATVSLGWHAIVDQSTIAAAVAEMGADPWRLREMSLSAAAITDGLGGARVADAIERIVA